MTVRISTDLFTHTGNGDFNAEHSELRFEPGFGPGSGHTPRSITLVNPKTGGERLYEGRISHFDREGDLTHWTWWSLQGGMLTVWND
jgi:hypothetical protein